MVSTPQMQRMLVRHTILDTQRQAASRSMRYILLGFFEQAHAYAGRTKRNPYHCFASGETIIREGLSAYAIFS